MAAAIKSPGKYPIEEEGMETKPEMVPVAVLDENVDVYLVWKIFSHDAWLVVTSVLKQKQQNPSFICKSCYHNLDMYVSIAYPGINEVCPFETTTESKILVLP